MRRNCRTAFLKNQPEESTEVQNLVRLPLWKACLELMIHEGITHGKTYSSEFFEKHLRLARTTCQFSFAISHIRRELEKLGFYLSGRGQQGNQFVILPPENNQLMMDSYSHAAITALKRGVILGTNTRLDSLSPDDRRRHESLLEKMVLKSILIKKSAKIVKLLPTIVQTKDGE